MTPLEKLASLLPAQWPTRDNTPPAEWDRIKGKIGLEDHNGWGNLDQACGRDPRATGSQRYIEEAGPEYPGSNNHKIEARKLVMVRDDDPRPLLAYMESPELQDWMGSEQDAKYLLIWSRAVFAAMLHAHDKKGRDWNRLRAALRLWAGWMFDRLDSHSLPRDETRASWNRNPKDRPTLEVYVAALRMEYSPEPGFGFLLEVMRGLPVNTESNLFVGAGNFTASGFPRLCGVFLALECRRRGLLRGVERVRPTLKWPEVHRYDGANKILSYLPLLEGWPGGSPTLVAVEKENGKPAETWVVSSKGPADLRTPPGPRWGFDPAAREIVEKKK